MTLINNVEPFSFYMVIGDLEYSYRAKFSVYCSIRAYLFSILYTYFLKQLTLDYLFYITFH